ncbi:F-box only protein 6 isoform X1 [Talpa occidentalis]|uniref:F-box only protein 6 isoform X1 n=2 Tax=Talpa occidentalis TaxID=50954 RepID=UPI0023FA0EAE|nr:F-box only protein 6 isoform X1 [Talpa occidentalis]
MPNGGRSPTRSPTIRPASATSGFSTAAWTLTTGPAGTARESPTAASPSGPRCPDAPEHPIIEPLTGLCAPHPTRAMAHVSINELPENILLEIFTHVPARQLLLCCRPVCSLWRDLIDVVTLWKSKCLREGFITADWDQPVADWKIFYFLHILRRNLLRNPCAEEGTRFWQLDMNGGDNWNVESIPGAHGTEFHDSSVKKYFVTSYEMCLKSQMVNLKAEGYWEELLDTYRPDIVVKDWFAARADCGCTYQIRIQLTSADYIVLASYEPPPVTIEQWSDARWREVSHTFSDYPPGVRHIHFQHGGHDTQFWAGWYGPRVTNSSITISPKMTRNPAPSEPQPETTQRAEDVHMPSVPRYVSFGPHVAF